MTTFQKILIGIPAILYIGLMCILFYTTSHIDVTFILIILGCAAFTLAFLLLFGVVIQSISAYRISVVGGVIITIWVPLIIGGFFVVRSYFVHGNDSNDYAINLQGSGWRTVYEGKENVIDSLARRYVDDTLLMKGRHSLYFLVLKPFFDDSANYAVYYYYACDGHPDTSSAMAVCMQSDTLGHILSHAIIEVNENPIALKLYQHTRSYNTILSKVIKEADKADGHTESKVDSTFGQTYELVSNDTIRKEDLPHGIIDDGKTVEQ